MAPRDEKGVLAHGEAPRDAAAFAAAVATAWVQGEAGWAQLGEAWGGAPEPGRPSASARCWWDGPPWHGRIAPDEFRAIVDAYAARYGAYTPDLPEREPDLLRAWLREHDPGAARPPRAVA